MSLELIIGIIIVLLLIAIINMLNHQNRSIIELRDKLSSKELNNEVLVQSLYGMMNSHSMQVDMAHSEMKAHLTHMAQELASMASKRC